MNKLFELFPGAKLGIARLRPIRAGVPAPTNHTAGVTGNGAMKGGSMKKLSSFLLCAAFTLCPAAAAQLPVNLGSAAPFAVLAGTTVTNTGPSIINGNLGVWPGTAVTGFGPGKVNGSIHAGDTAAQHAQASLTIAYNDAAARTSVPPVGVAGNLAGSTLHPGLYTSTSDLEITGGTLFLDGKGVYIFQIASALTVNSGSGVVLTGGAQAADVFWQVGSSATLGTTSFLKGNILALTSISIKNGATLDGRALARNGAVTLDTNVVTIPKAQKGQGDKDRKGHDDEDRKGHDDEDREE